MQSGGVKDPGLADVRFGQVPAQSHGPAGSLARAFDPHLIAAEDGVVHRAGVGAGGVGQGEAGVQGHRVFEHLQSELDVLAGLAPRVAFAAQVEVVGLQVFRGLVGQGLQFLRGKRHAQGLGDLAGHFVLYFENVLHLAVEALRPERKIGARVHELGADAQAGAGAAQGAGEDIRRAELLADLRRSHRLVAEGQNRGTRKGVQSADLGELGDDVLGDAVAQVFVFLGATLIFEIEHGDRFLLGCYLAAGDPSSVFSVAGRRLESRSRLRRFRSARSSAAVW